MEETRLANAARTLERRFISELSASAETAARYGLALDAQAVAAIAGRRSAALAETGRVELGESAVPKIVTAFCDSPYLLQEEFAETVGRLTEAFYEYKNEDGDRMTDDELITCLRACYDAYEGALDAALSLSIEDLLRKRRLDEPDDLPGGGEAAEDA